MFQIAKELKVLDERILPKDIYLDDLKKILLQHPAFFRTSKLELLAKKYNIDIIFIPKYHCELNPIEGAWCQMKNFFRKHNNQEAKELVPLVKKSREVFENSDINKDLWRRFFNIVKAYNSGKTYQQVLHEFYGEKYSDKIKSHRKIGMPKF